MKDLSLLVWFTQLGLSVAVPMAGFVLLAVWLHNRFGWGDWVIWTGLILGLLTAVSGFRSAMHTMGRMAKDKNQDPPVAFNDHD